jgi:hypothetical protein
LIGELIHGELLERVQPCAIEQPRVPPLAPPVAADQGAQLRVPAIGQTRVGLEEVAAVVAALVPNGLTANIASLARTRSAA